MFVRSFFSWPRGAATTTARPRLIENQSRLHIKVVYFPLIIIWAQGTVNGRCSRGTHCQDLGLLLFGSGPPFDTSSHRGRALSGVGSTQTHTHIHFVLVCFFFLFFVQKGARISDWVGKKPCFITWLGCAVSLLPCCGSPLLSSTPVLLLISLQVGKGRKTLGQYERW